MAATGTTQSGRFSIRPAAKRPPPEPGGSSTPCGRLPPASRAGVAAGAQIQRVGGVLPKLLDFYNKVVDHQKYPASHWYSKDETGKGKLKDQAPANDSPVDILPVGRAQPGYNHKAEDAAQADRIIGEIVVVHV